MNGCIVLKVIPTKAAPILGEVRKMLGVRKAYFTYGRFDMAIFAEVDDYKKLRELTTLINSLEGIRSSETLPEA